MQVSTDEHEEETIDKEAVLQSLREKAVEESSCGQSGVVERRFVSEPRSETIVYATVTNLRTFHCQQSVLANGDLKWKMEGSGTTSRKRSRTGKRKPRAQEEEEERSFFVYKQVNNLSSLTRKLGIWKVIGVYKG